MIALSQVPLGENQTPDLHWTPVMNQNFLPEIDFTLHDQQDFQTVKQVTTVSQQFIHWNDVNIEYCS